MRGLGLGIGISVFAVVLYSLAEISLQEVQVVILFTLLGIATTAESAFRWPLTEPEPPGEFVLGPRRFGGRALSGAP